MKKETSLSFREESPLIVSASLNEHFWQGWKVKKLKLKIDQNNRMSGVIILKKKEKKNAEEESSQ